jgi:amino acid transporter
MPGRIRRLLFGKPRDITSPGALQRLSLIAVMAWVGLGADGLSSTAYGPEEAFRALGAHKGLAVFLALAIALTVFVISYGYSRIIEEFPAGGGGYVVASKILGPRAGVVSGAALLVDYVLTVAISSAAGADALLSLVADDFQASKVLIASTGIAILTLVNMRGLRVLFVSPIFIAFLLTHVAVLAFALGEHAVELPRVATEVEREIDATLATLGLAGTLHLLLRAYALGAGTYTGIEAVSNAVPTLAEPQVETAQRTMFLMATSLAFMASGIVVAYLLFGVEPTAGKTMNAVLIEKVSSGWELGGIEIGRTFFATALLSEAGLLLIAAQAGFVDGPRVMANMANDSWLPHRFSALSDRLTMRNGVLLMAVGAAAAVIYTGGSVSKLVIVYSINVFLTFTLSNVSMVLYWFRHPGRGWKRHLALHLLASLLCLTILVTATYEKFSEGGWFTMLMTLAVVVLCFFVNRHYRLVGWAIDLLDVEFPGPEVGVRARKQYQDLLAEAPQGEPDPAEPVAVLFVGGYSPLGRKTLVTLLRTFPQHFKGVVFASIAIVDSGAFKGIHKIHDLEERAQAALDRYRDFAAALGLRSMAITSTGTEIALEAEKVARHLMSRYPKATFVGGQLNFEEDTLWYRLLHNETAYLIQRRLQYLGLPMVVLPTQLDLRAVDPWRWRRVFRRSERG